MTDLRMTTIEPRQMQKGVFQPGRAQIAREMRCRLNLSDDDVRRPRFGRFRRWWQ